MRILYYDCFAGISGDMNLAAMIDLGVDAHFLQEEMSKLDLDDEFELQVTQDNKKGISGTKVTVQLTKNSESGHHHSHRNINDIKNIITESCLELNIQKTAVDIFTAMSDN